MIEIIIGYILDLIIGDPNNPYHPIRFIGNLSKSLEGFFRKRISKNLKLSGILTNLSVIFITFFVVLFITKGTSYINTYLGIIVSGILIYFTISAKCLKVEGLKVIKELENGNIIEARKKLSYIVGRDTDKLNESEIYRAVIETASENMSDGIIAPLFYAGIGGAPLAFLYKAVNTCDSMFGYKNEKYIDFGFSSAKVDDIFNYIPARITSYLIIIASFVLRYKYKESYKIYKRDRYNHSSPNSAHPEAAVSGALSIMLGGSNYYFGKLVKKDTIGDKLKEIEKSDVIKTNKILDLVTFLGVVLAIIISFVIHIFL